MPINNNLKMLVIGINYRKTPLELRERFSFSEESVQRHYAVLKNHPAVQESFILSTCNRVEIYCVSRDLDAAEKSLANLWSWVREIHPDFLKNHFYRKTGEDAVKHLLRVASGLDSMVIGEPQIMGQIRKAYELACSSGAIGTYLHAVLQDSLKVGKKVRSLTGISRGVTSFSGVVIELIKKETGLEHKKVLVIGAGKVGGLTVKKLAELSLANITVTNRDMTRAAEFEKIQNVRVVDIDMLQPEISSADIIVAATAAPGYLVDLRMVEQAFAGRKKELLLIDLGVPRNIDDSLRDVPGIRLYNIDDLAPVVEGTIRNRELEAGKAEEIIRRELAIMREKNAVTTLKEPLCAESFSA